MAGAKNIEFRRLHLQRPVAAKQVQQLLIGLSAQRPAPAITLETWSTSVGVVQLIGAPVGQFDMLARLVEDLLPGSSILGSVAESARQIETVGRLRQRRRRRFCPRWPIRRTVANGWCCRSFWGPAYPHD